MTLRRPIRPVEEDCRGRPHRRSFSHGRRIRLSRFGTPRMGIRGFHSRGPFLVRISTDQRGPGGAAIPLPVVEHEGDSGKQDNLHLRGQKFLGDHYRAGRRHSVQRNRRTADCTDRRHLRPRARCRTHPGVFRLSSPQTECAHKQPPWYQ